VEFLNLRFDDVVVAVPVGRIDYSNAERLKQALAPLLDATNFPKNALILDFSGVEYICSVGLRVVMLAARQMRAQNGRIAVAALQPIVNEIFEISRFNHVIEIYPTMRAALQALSPTALAAYDASTNSSQQ
jgi:anti-sigma B factor antagonist